MNQPCHTGEGLVFPSPPHILLESDVCSLNPYRPPQRVNPSHYTINTVQNRWQLGQMRPRRAQELLGASQNLCCPGRMPGHLAQGYPWDVLGQASAGAVVDSTVFKAPSSWVDGPADPHTDWHQCLPLGHGTQRCGWCGCVPLIKVSVVFFIYFLVSILLNLVCYRI